MRNHLVHDDVISLTMLKSTIISILQVSTKPSRVQYLFSLAIEILVEVCETIPNYVPEETRPSDARLRILGDELPDVGYRGLSRDVIDRIDYDLARNIYHCVPVSFTEIKQGGMKEIIKGRRLLITTGNYTRKYCRFHAWNGNNCVVNIEDEGVSGLGSHVRILIFDEFVINDVIVPRLDTGDFVAIEEQETEEQELPTEPKTIESFARSDYLRKTIKGKTVMIHDGLYTGHTGKFKSWLHSSGRIEIENIGLKTLSSARKISVL